MICDFVLVIHQPFTSFPGESTQTQKGEIPDPMGTVIFSPCIASPQCQTGNTPESKEKVTRTAQERIQNREVYFTLSVQENNRHKPVQNVQQNH